MIADVGTEKLSAFSFSENANDMLFTLTAASNLALWKIEGDLDSKDPTSPLVCKPLAGMSSGAVSPQCLNPHPYVRHLVYVIGSKNHLVLCNIEALKAAEDRAIPELDKVSSISVSKEGAMSLVMLADNQGKVCGVDGRMGKAGLAFTMPSQLKMPQIVEMAKYGHHSVAVYGQEYMDRKVKLFDLRKPSMPLQILPVDQMKTEVLFPIYDEDTGICLSLSRRSNKMYSHVFAENGQLKPLLPIPLKDEVMAFAAFPKPIVDVRNVEILRIAVLTPENTVKVLSVVVPKKSVSTCKSPD